MCPPVPRVLPAWGCETAEGTRCDENSLGCSYKATGAAVVLGFALVAPGLRKCQLGSCPFCATSVPPLPCAVLSWQPSELSMWSSQAGSGCSGSPSWQSRLGQGLAETPIAGSHSSRVLWVAVQAFLRAGRRKGGDCWNWRCCVSTAVLRPHGHRKLISSSEDTLTNAGFAGAVGLGFRGMESMVPTVCLDTSRDIPASVSVWQEVGLSHLLLQLLCPAQNMLRIRKKLLA